jgi:uncharacterized protein
MEEILASIRRIIADDDTLPGARRQRDEQRRREEDAPAVEAPVISVQNAYPAPVLEPEPEPVAERQQPAPVADIRQLRLNRAAPEPVLEEAEDVEEDYADEPDLSDALVSAAEAPVESYEHAESAPLVSADAASSIASHFQALAASMIINDSGLLQKYAQEMLRPMLKQWLDDNLPVIVERLVRAEIERVARGGRR